MPRLDTAARWRGASTALLTAALAVGAHALAGGVPSGAGVALAVVLAAAVGALAASTRHALGICGLVAVLAAGQVLGHAVMAAAGHAHSAHVAPTSLMVGAHGAAVVAGAVLIAAGDRLCRALSTMVRALIVRAPRPSHVVDIAAAAANQPMQWMLLLRASVSHRGPPVGALS